MTKKAEAKDEDERPMEFVIVSISEGRHPETIELALRRHYTEEDARKEMTAEMLKGMREANLAPQAALVPLDPLVESPETPDIKVEKKKSRVQEEFQAMMEMVGEQVQVMLKTKMAPSQMRMHEHHMEPTMQLVIRKKKYLKHRYMVGDGVAAHLSAPLSGR